MKPETAASVAAFAAGIHAASAWASATDGHAWSTLWFCASTAFMLALCGSARRAAEQPSTDPLDDATGQGRR